jgi:hypothetical protein
MIPGTIGMRYFAAVDQGHRFETSVWMHIHPFGLIGGLNPPRRVVIQHQKRVRALHRQLLARK